METISFLSHKQINKEIKNLFNISQKIYCAVAFWGNGAIEELGLLDAGKEVKVICNLSMGASNPSVIRKLWTKWGDNIKSHDTLHAKVYLTEKGAVITSANASANGLNFENNELLGWHEAGVFVNGPILKDIFNWFKDIERQGLTINDYQLQKAEILWKVRRNMRPENPSRTDKNESLLDYFAQNRENFKDRNIYIIICRDKNISEQAEKTLEKWEVENKFNPNQRFECYENWDELINIPKESKIIDLYYGQRGGKSVNGIFEIPKKDNVVKIKGKSHSIFVVEKIDSIKDRKLSPKDKELLKSKIESLLFNEHSDAEDMFIKLYDAWPILFN